MKVSSSEVISIYQNVSSKFIGQELNHISPYMVGKVNKFIKETSNWSMVDYHKYTIFVFNILAWNNQANITPSLVYNSKFLEKYAKSKYVDFIIEKVSEERGINLPNYNPPISGISKAYLIKQKKRYFNTPRGYIYCQSFGDSIKANDIVCNRCIYKQNCIK